MKAIWQKPGFVDIRMDCEINSYYDEFDNGPAF
jgi:hypothetical protein